MARFDVYANPDTDERRLVPFLLDLQNDFLGPVQTRVVVPLWSAEAFGRPMGGLNPEFLVDKHSVVMDTASIGAIPAGELRRPVASLASRRLDITTALDTLFGSY